VPMERSSIERPIVLDSAMEVSYHISYQLSDCV